MQVSDATHTISYGVAWGRVYCYPHRTPEAGPYAGLILPLGLVPTLREKIASCDATRPAEVGQGGDYVELVGLEGSDGLLVRGWAYGNYRIGETGPLRAPQALWIAMLDEVRAGIAGLADAPPSARPPLTDVLRAPRRTAPEAV